MDAQSILHLKQSRNQFTQCWKKQIQELVPLVMELDQAKTTKTIKVVVDGGYRQT